MVSLSLDNVLGHEMRAADAPSKAKAISGPAFAASLSFGGMVSCHSHVTIQHLQVRLLMFCWKKAEICSSEL